jgi:hypothetical protein
MARLVDKEHLDLPVSLESRDLKAIMVTWVELDHQEFLECQDLKGLKEVLGAMDHLDCRANLVHQDHQETGEIPVFQDLLVQLEEEVPMGLKESAVTLAVKERRDQLVLLACLDLPDPSVREENEEKKVQWVRQDHQD